MRKSYSRFFRFKNKIVEEILQKVSNYRMKLTIIGNFSNVKSLNDFIYESYKGSQVNFKESLLQTLK